MASKTDNYTFAVSGKPTIRAKNSAGEVRITGGEGNQVAVRVTRRHTGFGLGRGESDLDAVQVHVEQQDDTITLTTEHPMRPTNIAVDMEITVPRESQLDLDLAAGHTEVRDTTGPTTIKVAAGELRLARVRCTESSRLDVATGQITGSVTLGAGASLDVAVSAGQVTLDIPVTTSAEVDARTEVGQITIDGLPLATTRRNFVSASTEGRLGDGTGRLSLHVATGSITLRGR